MMETLDGAFCPKMNSDPRLVCVSVLYGWLLFSWDFFFSHCVTFSFFLFLHCHSCFLFGIIYYTLLRPQITGP